MSAPLLRPCLHAATSRHEDQSDSFSLGRYNAGSVEACGKGEVKNQIPPPCLRPSTGSFRTEKIFVPALRIPSSARSSRALSYANE